MDILVTLVATMEGMNCRLTGDLVPFCHQCDLITRGRCELCLCLWICSSIAVHSSRHTTTTEQSVFLFLLWNVVKYRVYSALSRLLLACWLMTLISNYRMAGFPLMLSSSGVWTVWFYSPFVIVLTYVLRQNGKILNSKTW